MKKYVIVLACLFTLIASAYSREQWAVAKASIPIKSVYGDSNQVGYSANQVIHNRGSLANSY